MIVGNQSDYNDYEDYYYDYDHAVNEISVGDMVVPLLVYTITFTIGLMGNILILVAVGGQTQVCTMIIRYQPRGQLAHHIYHPQG